MSIGSRINLHAIYIPLWWLQGAKALSVYSIAELRKKKKKKKQCLNIDAIFNIAGGRAKDSEEKEGRWHLRVEERRKKKVSGPLELSSKQHQSIYNQYNLY